MAACLRGSFALTQISVIMLVFSLAGCVAGSCLSYGHSCWGAHGKRDGGSAEKGLRLVLAKALMDESLRNAASSPFTREQWISSSSMDRGSLIPSSGRYRIRWNDVLPGERLISSKNWQNLKHQPTTIGMNEESFRARGRVEDDSDTMNEEKRILEARETMDMDSNEELNKSNGLIYDRTNDDADADVPLMQPEDTNDVSQRENPRAVNLLGILRRTEEYVE